eukprot:TRINITY_DN3416_c0_g2_i1.p1 TRINITY_DN3416_c0_g2~~TRINITY_DN3416_c0_g2_i1.p1  ORF type:complete len:319 (+),score=55.87 TRINITY_DN3416_c0_g2_i1:193-1149(+)
MQANQVIENSNANRKKSKAAERSKDVEIETCEEMKEEIIVEKRRKTTNETVVALSVASNEVAVLEQPFNSTPKRSGMLRVGTSGYVYNHWKGVFYPLKLPQKKWFEYYTQMFDTVEINNTFYRLPSGETFDSWRDQAPEGFCYALKFSRFGTHIKRLKDPAQPISLFVDRAARLGKSLVGPILVQLPPKFDVNVERLKGFLSCAPKDYRWAFEFRDISWLCEDVYALLKSHNASLCIHDHEDIPCEHPKVLTADWVYLRFHGKNYQHCYSHKELKGHATWIQKLLNEGMDVYAYFNNDFGGYAVSNAAALRELIGSLS